MAYKYGLELEFCAVHCSHNERESFQDSDVFLVYRQKQYETKKDLIYRIQLDNIYPPLSKIYKYQGQLEIINAEVFDQPCTSDLLSPITAFSDFLKNNTAFIEGGNFILNPQTASFKQTFWQDQQLVTYSFEYQLKFPLFLSKNPFHEADKVDAIAPQATFDVSYRSLANFYYYNLDEKYKNVIQSRCAEKPLFSLKAQEIFEKTFLNKEEYPLNYPLTAFNFIEFLRYYFIASSFKNMQITHIGNKVLFRLLSRLSLKQMAHHALSSHKSHLTPFEVSNHLSSCLSQYFAETISDYGAMKLFPEMYPNCTISMETKETIVQGFYFLKEPKGPSIEEIRDNVNSLYTNTNELITSENMINSIFYPDLSPYIEQKKFGSFYSLQIMTNAENPVLDNKLVENMRIIMKVFFQNIVKVFLKEYTANNLTSHYAMSADQNIAIWDWFSPLPLQEPNDPMGLLSRLNPKRSAENAIIEVRSYENFKTYNKETEEILIERLNRGYQGDWPDHPALLSQNKSDTLIVRLLSV